MTSLRKGIALAILAASLALPTGVFAASSTGTTPETLAYVQTVALTAPASAAFLDVPANVRWESDESVTAISTNDPLGATITMTVDPLVGPATIPTTQRGASSINGTGGVTGVPSAAIGFFVSSATVKTIGTSSTVLTNGSVSLVQYVNESSFSVFGNYTSAAHYTATTN
jgi:hypothetical protein